MNISENITNAIGCIKSNKMRSFLTMLGIIIGISSVIMITTLGIIADKGLNKLFSDIGISNRVIYPYVASNENPVRSRLNRDDTIKEEMIEDYKKKFSNYIVDTSISINAGSGNIQKGKIKKDVILNSIDIGFLSANGFKLSKGRNIQENDIEKTKHICLIPNKLAKKLFKDESSALGQQITVNLNDTFLDFTIVGTYKKPPSTFMGEEKDSVFIPISIGKEIIYNFSGHFFFTVTAKDNIDLDELSEKTINYLNRKYYSENDSFKILVDNTEEYLTMIYKFLNILKLILSIIAGISLVVGGIGVMNIMLVSVTERTREIGIRKALGAPNSAIRTQFIVKSSIICIIGGIIGVILGVVLGNVGGLIIKTNASPSILAIIIAVIFSMAIGIFFGYYPANKASKLDPIEALRYE